MTAVPGGTSLCHVGWRDNRDALDVALAVNRLLAHGEPAWWLMSAGADHEAGDYLVALTPARERALGDFGIRTTRWRAGIPAHAHSLTPAATCLFAGTASKFPYFAYYALALLRVGLDYVPCSGHELANGILNAANLLVLPGGFATWGIDAAENTRGADDNVRDFLERGGTAIGSCGGAFYLSAGRPAWTGTAQAKPLYTHEYLQSGVGIVDIEMRVTPLAFGCPPTMETPYYHGPIYDRIAGDIEVAATFRSLSVPGRLAIDNPLDQERFRRDMADKPAILLASGKRGRAVLFSPHPEMGDLIRKYIALDGYVRHYLPIRGYGTMRDTMRHYRVIDAPSFRLIVNAVHDLMRHAPKITSSPRVATASVDSCDLVDVCRRAAQALPALADGDDGDLLRDVAAGIRTRLDGAAARFACMRRRVDELLRLRPAYDHLAATMIDHQAMASTLTPAHALMELDLSVALLETWTRVAEFDIALGRSG